MPYKVKGCLWITVVASISTCIIVLYHLTHIVTPNISSINVLPRNSLRASSKSTAVLLSDKDRIKSRVNGNRGFLVVNKYFEQQTGAAINMLTLAKWAKTVGALPVEPFVKDSTFHNMQVTNISELDNLLRFRDYFDIDLWNNKSVSANAMPLVSYNTFLTHKPNHIILVVITYKDLPSLVYIDSEITSKLEDSIIQGFSNFESGIKKFTELYSMTIIRRVYMSFISHNAIHMKRFNEIIYGDFDPSSVVVWFQLWEGIAQTSRIKILEKEYHRNLEVFDMLQTSQRIIVDSRKYAKQILKSNFGDYLAISFRSVKRAKFFQVKNMSDQQPEFFKSCIERLKHTVGLLSSTRKIFLALDLGKFGDNKAKKYLPSDQIKMIERELFDILYDDNKLTLKRWEEQFVKVTRGITDSGYIATMQSTLLENSGCLIMFGGDSNFQRSLLMNYQKKHSNPCIREVCYIH